jgi:hypothetical protein
MLGDAGEGERAHLVKIVLTDPGVIVEWVRECLFERGWDIGSLKRSNRLPWQE